MVQIEMFTFLTGYKYDVRTYLFVHTLIDIQNKL